MTALPRLRRPEHTGDGRCWPCTVVNVVVLAVLTGVVALVATPLADGVALVAPALVAFVGLVAIWFRGYLIPYTPRFAPRLVARLPGDYFAHTAPSETLGDLDGADGNGTDGVDGDDVLRELVAVGVVDVDGEHLEPTEAFASAWRREMDALAADSDDRLVDAVRDALARVESARVERTGSETFLVVTGVDGSTTWLRRPVAVAEVAAARALAETDLRPEIRGLAAHALCAFLETCPICDADVVETTPEDCCGHTLSGTTDDRSNVLACETCGVVFYEFR
ncbi:hypothetical protein [Halobellus rarus]|uniref:Restriction endonuclease n=1 Tax=Halobellus rarus TaxID=1126237 RepID=A0ABD6CS64_9EURY|nr:hypothetical protein [Halobellus rarus]